MLALDADRITEAKNALAELQGVHGGSIHARTLQAAIELHLHHNAEALRLLSSTPAEGELRTPILLMRGEALYRLGELSNAGATFRQLSAFDDQNVDAHRWLAAIYYDLGAMELAISEMEAVARLDPLDYRPHRLIGLIHRDFEQYGEAVAEYEAALAHRPPALIEAEIRLEMSDSLAHLHRYEEALAALPDRPSSAAWFALKAECLSNLGRAQEAEHAIAEGLQSDPSDRDVRFASARLALDAGNIGKAIDLLSAILSNDPHDYRARHQLAIAMRLSGDEAACKMELERMQASRELYLRLAELNQIAIQKPADAEVRESLAAVCGELGRPGLAEMWSQAARACREANAAGAASGALQPD